jgi:hypothetical protein
MIRVSPTSIRFFNLGLGERRIRPLPGEDIV